jgi:hypothetical protein
MAMNMPLANDLSTEGSETLYLQYYTDSARSVVAGSAVAVTIYDTSKGTGTYSLSAGSSSVDEGSSASFTVGTANVDVGSILIYSLSGVSAADVVGGLLSGNTTVGAGGKASFAVSLVADLLTEGAETLIATVQDQSASVTVNDTSKSVVTTNQAPTGSVTITGTATQGQTLLVANTLADTDGLGAITYQWMADNVKIIGATNSTFVLTEAQVGKVILVAASYTDGHGSAETASSRATGVIASAFGAAFGFVELQNLTLKQNAVSGTTTVKFAIYCDASVIGDQKIVGGVVDLVYDYSKVSSAIVSSTTFGESKTAVWSLITHNLAGASANGKIAVVADNDVANPIVDANGKVLTVSLTVTGLVSSFDIGLESGNLGGSTEFKTADNVSHAVTVGASKTASNNAPVALSLDVATDQGVAKSGLLSATDADGNPLSFAKLTGPAHGTVTIDATTGAYTYAPSPRYTGADGFSFVSNDGLVDSAPATVSISVTDTVNTQFQAYSWRTHKLLDGVQVGESGSSALHSTASNGAVSFSAKAGLIIALNAQRPIPTAEDQDTGQAVNLQDAIAILKMIVGLDVNGAGKALSPYQAYAADFDGNGKVELSDAIGVLKHVVGLPAPDVQWLFFNEADASVPGKSSLNPGAMPALTATLATTGATHVGLVGVLRGDVDGSYGGGGSQSLDLAYFQHLAADMGLNLAQFGVYGP